MAQQSAEGSLRSTNAGSCESPIEGVSGENALSNVAQQELNPRPVPRSTGSPPPLIVLPASDIFIILDLVSDVQRTLQVQRVPTLAHIDH